MITAKELDNETNYTYFGARYYDSELSVWLSVDPMSDKYPSLSPYCYTADNPVVLVDPNGEKIKGVRYNPKTDEFHYSKWAIKHGTDQYVNARIKTQSGKANILYFVNEKKTYRFIVTNDILLEPQENGKYGIIAGLAESNYNFIILSLNKIGFNDITNDDLKNAKVINKYGKLKLISVSKNDLMQIDEIEEYNLGYLEKYIKGRDDAGYTEFNIKYPFLTDEQRIHGVGAHEETHLMPQNIEYQEKNDYYNSEKEAYENEIRERSEYIKENNIQY